ncbi:hypothetical protein BLI708_00380 [Bifidobacterium imperatoris]|uniref:Uncharacterized protein n=1 Tax=Bifidobacterium imperatoris TaxID=2020965 RepID=A0A2N5IPA8_9BIFI|nr:hypothetical protein [Bifidobacterium imperatoris]PLS23784.1 hypothetical protein Tam1G_2156 [Bifidobacterium imperatoris]QSY57834.1 hypothetical protein BLI708_00380 [Bifidobacterium imperatoris]
MELQVHSPYTSVEIVTNMTALRAAIELTNRINELKALENMTEAEASAARGEREKLAKQLSKTVQDVQKSTLTVTLEGLRANEWNQLILRCTSMENGRQSRDMNRLLQLAFPRMLRAIKDPVGKAMEASPESVKTLLDSLTDSQTAEILTTIQELNTPVTSLPKETLTLLASLN